MLQGYLCVIGAMLIWGFLPIYWKLMTFISSADGLAYRMIFSAIFAVVFILVRRQGQLLFRSLTEPTRLAKGFLASLLIGVNWFVYIWGVQHGMVVECSLGYFISPLLNAAFGILLFKERLSRLKLVALGIAAISVLIAVVRFGELPLVSLALAFSFGIYGVLHKRSDLKGMLALGQEGVILTLPALIYLSSVDLGGGFSPGEAVGTRLGLLESFSWIQLLLIISLGPVTVLPLWLFHKAAKILPLSSVGLIQYLAPSIQFLLGVFLYREPFKAADALLFAGIWTALAIYTVDTLRGVQLKRRSIKS